MNKLYYYIGLAFVAILIIVVVGMIFSLPVMWLWNYCLVPATSALNEISWLQAWGILILFGLLFKSSHVSK